MLYVASSATMTTVVAVITRTAMRGAIRPRAMSTQRASMGSVAECSRAILLARVAFVGDFGGRGLASAIRGWLAICSV